MGNIMGDGQRLIMLLLSIHSRWPDATCMHSSDPTSSRSFQLALRRYDLKLRFSFCEVSEGGVVFTVLMISGGVYPFKAAVKRGEMNEGIRLILFSAESAFTLIN